MQHATVCCTLQRFVARCMSYIACCMLHVQVTPPETEMKDANAAPAASGVEKSANGCACMLVACRIFVACRMLHVACLSRLACCTLHVRTSTWHKSWPCCMFVACRTPHVSCCMFEHLQGVYVDHRQSTSHRRRPVRGRAAQSYHATCNMQQIIGGVLFGNAMHNRIIKKCQWLIGVLRC